MRSVLVLAVLLGLTVYAVERGRVSRPGTTQVSNDDAVLAEAFEQRKRNLQVMGAGEVVRVLADDKQGSRHQRFIVQLSTGQTVLIAHNIDLAARVPDLQPGDHIQFFGEYEWNEHGGVVHWTHHDPGRRHIDGWLKHDGTTYQ